MTKHISAPINFAAWFENWAETHMTPNGLSMQWLENVMGQAFDAGSDVAPVTNQEGWQLVPTEPTQNMWDEAKMMAEAMIKNHTSLDLGLIYQTMLAAAPKPKE